MLTLGVVDWWRNVSFMAQKKNLKAVYSALWWFHNTVQIHISLIFSTLSWCFGPWRIKLDLCGCIILSCCYYTNQTSKAKRITSSANKCYQCLIPLAIGTHPVVPLFPLICSKIGDEPIVCAAVWKLMKYHFSFFFHSYLLFRGII